MFLYGATPNSLVGKMNEIRFQKIHDAATLPQTYSEHAVGWDIYACLIGESNRHVKLLIPPRTTRNVPTALLIEPPQGFAVLILSRSGLASKSIFVANAPGLIDPDYRGELKVLLYNGGHESVYIEHGQRVAQLLLMPLVPLSIVEVEELTPTERGASGFGSTGT